MKSNKDSEYIQQESHKLGLIRRSLSEVNWNDDDVDSDYNKFLIKYNELYDECVSFQ